MLYLHVRMTQETQANGILSWLNKLRSVSGGVEDEEPRALKVRVTAFVSMC